MVGSTGIAESPRAPPRSRVMVIDDDPGSAMALGEALELATCDVCVCFSGSEGLAKGREFAPDVVVIDLVMPKPNGYDVVAAMRQEPWSRTSVFVAYTGMANKEYIRQSYTAGFDYHINKPAAVGVFEQIVASRGRPSAFVATLPRKPVADPAALESGLHTTLELTLSAARMAKATIPELTAARSILARLMSPFSANGNASDFSSPVADEAIPPGTIATLRELRTALLTIETELRRRGVE